MYKSHLKKGFTLIELLVVIAIIAVLIAIIMPSFGAVKRRVHAVMCKNNLKQVGLAATLYADDYGNKLPRACVLPSDPDAIIWFIEFLPYIGQDRSVVNYQTVKAFKCPGYEKVGHGYGYDETGTEIDVMNRYQTISYVVNGWGDGIVESTKPINYASQRSTFSKVYLADTESKPWRPIIQKSTDVGIEKGDFYMDEHLPWQADPTDPEGDAAKISGRRISPDRHQGEFNVLYLDWSVENVSVDDVTIQNFEID